MKEVSSNIDKEARKILKRWARQEFYIYLRPLSSLFLDPKGDFRIHWTVSVEYRTVNPVQLRGEGYNLSEVIKELDERVPERKVKKPGYNPNKKMGWLVPKKIMEKEIKDAKKKRTNGAKKKKKRVA